MPLFYPETLLCASFACARVRCSDELVSTGKGRAKPCAQRLAVSCALGGEEPVQWGGRKESVARGSTDAPHDFPKPFRSDRRVRRNARRIVLFRQRRRRRRC